MNRLQESREYVGFTGAEVAKVLGMTEVDLHEAEDTGHVEPERLTRMAELYRRTPAYLMGTAPPPVVPTMVEDLLARCRLSGPDADAVRRFAGFLGHTSGEA